MVERIRRLWNLKSIYFVQLAHDFAWVQKGHDWAVAALPELFVECFGGISNCRGTVKGSSFPARPPR